VLPAFPAPRPTAEALASGVVGPAELTCTRRCLRCAVLGWWLLRLRWGSNDAFLAGGGEQTEAEANGGLPVPVHGKPFTFEHARRRASSSPSPPPPRPSRTASSLSKLLGAELRPGTWWLTRIVFLRALGGVYLTAFLVGLHQNGALLGERGLLPATTYMAAVRRSHQQPPPAAVGAAVDQSIGAAWLHFLSHPSLLWFVQPGDEEHCLEICALLGAALSALLLLRGAGNVPMMATLWLLYMTIANAGQRWYSFGWESQLLETGFLAIWLCGIRLLTNTHARPLGLSSDCCRWLQLSRAVAGRTAAADPHPRRVHLGLPMADFSHHDVRHLHQPPRATACSHRLHPHPW
jgi:hypothetical protein